MAKGVFDWPSQVNGREGAERSVKGDGHWQWSGPAVRRDEDLTATDLCRRVSVVIR